MESPKAQPWLHIVLTVYETINTKANQIKTLAFISNIKDNFK